DRAMEWLSLETDDNIDCSSFTSGDLPEASTSNPSSFAHEHLDVHSYTAAIIKHVAPFLETENTEALAAFAPHLQNDPLFPDLIREEPFLLPYLSKIEDPSLVLSATSNYIAFLKKIDPSFSPKDLATFFASFYTKVARLYPPTAEITMLAFRAIEECGYHTDSSQNPIFTAIMESFESASQQLCQLQISKYVVRYLPNVFFLLPSSLQDNKDLILHVLPQNPFLYFLLSNNLKTDREIAKLAVQNGVAASHTPYPELEASAPTALCKTLLQAYANFDRLMKNFAPSPSHVKKALEPV
ncbi:MAG: DUF4116 domain-containing protein, partial [Verrucomicrobia bacterium]|nr:DUF4116 domain-containing protein [Verrucomicrobiota bacterium]